MPRIHRRHPALAIFVFLILCSGNAAAELVLDWGQIQDPRIREPLFDLYDESYFSGIVRLTANQNYADLGKEKDVASLVLAALYMGYGMPERCREILLDLEDRGISSDTQERLWYYLAKYYFRHDRIDSAVTALAQVDSRRLGTLQRDYLLLKADIEARNNATTAAIRTLSGVGGEGNYPWFARYNRAVLLLQQGKSRKGIKLLEELSQSESLDPELIALSEKAGLALARHYLKNNQPARAKDYLMQIRVDSPLTPQALLGIGWSYAGLQDYRTAMGYWEELARNSVSDPVVIEAMIARGYGLHMQKAIAEAMDQYEKTTVVIKTEMRRINSISKSVQHGDILDNILREEPLTEAGWFGDMSNPPDIPSRPYLLEFFSSHGFQEAYKKHRDLQYLGQQLQQWSAALNNYNGMSSSFRESYMRRLVKQQGRLSALQAKSHKYLQEITVAWLEQRHQLLNELLTQTRFQLAQILDQIGRGDN